MDQAKHGHRLSASTIPSSICTPDIVVDNNDPRRVEQIVQSVAGGDVRFGIDTQGKDTANLLLRSLTGSTAAPADFNVIIPTKHTHLVGLTGLPKLDNQTQAVTLHNVPIKVFHEVPEIGNALAIWLEQLLAHGKLRPPEPVGIEEGFEGVNRGLQKMRKQGGRVVVRI